MHYSKVGLEELLKNEAFVLWVLQPGESSNQYWNNWLIEHPGKKELLLKAKQLVQLLHDAEKEELTVAEKNQMTDHAWEIITDRVNNNGQVVHLRKRWYKYAVAASVIGLIGLAVLIFQRINKNIPGQKSPQLVINKISPSESELVNNETKPRMVYLVDGSTITLEKNSSIRYARFLQHDKREVQLEGEAFFNIAKDAKRPFYVYVQGIAVKVLGTSFRIVANKQDGKVTVAVKTGKVSVFRKDNGQQKEEMVLAPREQAVFTNKQGIMVRSKVADSLFIKPPVIDRENFSFVDKPVNEIIEKLAKLYAVDIRYNKEKFEICGGITVSLDAATLEEKLTILCKVLGATFKIENDTILIDGTGCR